jgi:hypothetical protein
VVAFDEDARYRAVKVFDAPAYERLREMASKVRPSAGDCRLALDVALAGPYSRIIESALEKGPDAEVVAYCRAEVARARALSGADPAGCHDVLLGRGAVSDAEIATFLDKLPAGVRKASDEADVALLSRARLEGPRSGSLTDKEAFDRGGGFAWPPGIEAAVNPNAPQCTRLVPRRAHRKPDALAVDQVLHD